MPGPWDAPVGMAGPELLKDDEGPSTECEVCGELFFGERDLGRHLMEKESDRMHRVQELLKA